MFKLGLLSLTCLFLFVVCISCSQTDDEQTPDELSTNLSVSMHGMTFSTNAADRIHHATVYFVDVPNSIFIKSQKGTVSEDGTKVSINTTFSADYRGKEIQAYFISNASELSDPLNIQPGTSLNISRFANLTTRDPLYGTNSRYTMSAKVTFQAGDVQIPEIKFNRTFAKVYIVPSSDMDIEQQRKIRLVSAQIVSAAAEGYLFKEGVVKKRADTRTIVVDKTLDGLNNAPLCYLYPDEEDAHLTVTLRNEISGHVITRRVIFRPQKNTAHKLTILSVPDGNSDYSITVADWDADILLPDTETSESSEIHVEEGIDLINRSEVYYYYNLLNDSEKELYRSIFHITNNFTETPPVGGRLEIELPHSLQGKFAREDFNKVTEYLWNDMPVLFNSGRAIPYRMSSGKVHTYRLGFNADRARYDMRVGLVIKAAREFLDTLEPGKSEYEIVKNVHDKFLRSVSYGGMTSALGGNIVGGLVDKKAVCEGYSATFQYLLQRCGIQVLFIGGEVISSNRPTPHAWNIVRIEGKYYYVDSTWDDGMVGLPPDFVQYTYFLKSKKTMDKDHTVRMNIPIPGCLEDYPLNF